MSSGLAGAARNARRHFPRQDVRRASGCLCLFIFIPWGEGPRWFDCELGAFEWPVEIQADSSGSHFNTCILNLSKQALFIHK